MFWFRRRWTTKKLPSKNNRIQNTVSDQTGTIVTHEPNAEASKIDSHTPGQRPYCFSNHLSSYIGQTVTVFVKSGGKSGLGFTGSLLCVNEDYISLLTRVGPPPQCSLGGCFLTGSHNYPYIFSNQQYRYPGGYSKQMGSIAFIPTDKIAAFVGTLLN